MQTVDIQDMAEWLASRRKIAPQWSSRPGLTYVTPNQLLYIFHAKGQLPINLRVLKALIKNFHVWNETTPEYQFKQNLSLLLVRSFLRFVSLFPTDELVAIRHMPPARVSRIVKMMAQSLPENPAVYHSKTDDLLALDSFAVGQTVQPEISLGF